MSNKSAKSQGGRRGKKGAKTQKKGKGASDWNKKVMEIYRKMKKNDSSVRLGAAMKEASRLKKAGKL